MSKFIPNSFQVPNIIIDEVAEQISPKAFACLIFIIRKTKGWNKESDDIAFSQFKAFLKTKDDRTIHKIISELEVFNLIKVVRECGRFNRYTLSESYPQPPTKNAGAKNDTTHKKCSVLPTKIVGSTTHKKCGSTKDNINTIQNTIRARDRFIESYPKKIRYRDICDQWVKLDKKHNLVNRSDMIIDDIEKRLKHDRSWLNGFFPDPIKYITGERWQDEIQKPFANDSKNDLPVWAKMPPLDDDLLPWALENGYPSSGQLTYIQYRAHLKVLISKRLNEQ